MNPIRITIPDATPSPAQQAARVVMNLMREEGMDPAKAYGVPLIREIVVGWRDGQHTEAQVRHMLRNCLILNPGLRAKGEVQR